MTQLRMLCGALFRPRPTFARLADGVRWVWVAALAVLLAASLANVTASVPLQMKAQMEFGQLQEAGAEARSAPATVVEGRNGVVAEESPAKDEEAGDLVAPTGDQEASARALATTAGLVFGAVGVIASLLLTAAFFFVAGKVWAKRVTFTTYLSMVSLAAMPLAARDLVQTAYQSITGTWIQHQGISSLVAVKDAMAQGGLLYGLLAQVDVWSIWALVLLFVGVTFTAKLERKRALIALGIFTATTVLIRAVPAIVTGAFASAAG